MESEINRPYPGFAGKEGNSRSLQIAVVALSAGLLVYSFTGQCYCTTNQCGDAVIVFFLGWLGIFFGGAALTWLANPLIILAWILTFRNSRHAFIVSAVAGLICLSFLFFDTVIDNEAGHYNPVTAYKSGYWLWTLSAFTLAAGNLFLMIRKGLRKKPL